MSECLSHIPCYISHYAQNASSNTSAHPSCVKDVSISNTMDTGTKQCVRLYRAKLVSLLTDRNQCLNNSPPFSATCSFFQWCMEIPRGERKTPVGLCPGRVCKQKAKAGQANGSCTFGLCKGCCADAQEALAGIRKCSVSQHNLPAPSHPAALPQRGVQGPQQHQPSPHTDKASDTALPIQPKQGSSRQSYRVSVSPMYQEKLRALDFEEVKRREDTAQTVVDTRTLARLVTIYWWSKVCEEVNY